MSHDAEVALPNFRCEPPHEQEPSAPLTQACRNGLMK